MKSKRWLLVGLSLPILVLLGWFLYEQILIWVTPAPHWTIRGAPSMYLCEDIVRWALGEVAPVKDVPTAPITGLRANDIIQRVLARHYGFVPFFVLGSPGLVQATFPDGQQRSAWCGVTMREYHEETQLGKATAVCIDALTGEPLMVIPDVEVAGFSCEAPVLDLPFTWQQCVALSLASGYLFILAAIRGVVWLWRRLVATFWNRRARRLRHQE
jgi:hypothetical protein